MLKSREILSHIPFRPYTPVVEVTLPAVPGSVSRARDILSPAVVEKSLRAGPPRRRFTPHEVRILQARQDELELAMSELATNAVRYGFPQKAKASEGAEKKMVAGVGKERLHLWKRRGVVLYVRDDNPTSPTFKPATPDAESGRGGGIVEILADRTGHFKTHSARGIRRLSAVFSEPDKKEVYGIFRSEKSPLAEAA